MEVKPLGSILIILLFALLSYCIYNAVNPIMLIIYIGILLIVISTILYTAYISSER